MSDDDEQLNGVARTHLEDAEEVVVLLGHVLQLGLDQLEDERGGDQRAGVDQRVVGLVWRRKQEMFI